MVHKIKNKNIYVYLPNLAKHLSSISDFSHPKIHFFYTEISLIRFSTRISENFREWEIDFLLQSFSTNENYLPCPIQSYDFI